VELPVPVGQVTREVDSAGQLILPSNSSVLQAVVVLLAPVVLHMQVLVFVVPSKI